MNAFFLLFFRFFLFLICIHSGGTNEAVVGGNKEFVEEKIIIT